VSSSFEDRDEATPVAISSAKRLESHVMLSRIRSIEKDTPADHRFKELDEEFERVQRREIEAISQYALKDNTEWFAESFMLYYAHPMHLRRTAPGSYRVLDRLTT
jgi:hypothetical protein